MHINSLRGQRFLSIDLRQSKLPLQSTSLFLWDGAMADGELIWRQIVIVPRDVGDWIDAFKAPSYQVETGSMQWVYKYRYTSGFGFLEWPL
jgi:hypothetical protein